MDREEIVEVEMVEREIDRIVPRIFDAGELYSEIPPGFNAVKISLDGRMRGDLNWKKQIEAAHQYVDQGLYLFWELDLGLFEHLNYPLSHQTQFLSLGLSIDHFRDTIWEKFSDHTLGVALYRGSIDFSIGFQWNESQFANFQEWVREGFETESNFSKETGINLQNFEDLSLDQLRPKPEGLALIQFFCRDVAVGYLDLLANRLPDLLKLYLVLDTCDVENPLLKARLLTKECFEHFRLVVKDQGMILGDMAWDKGYGNRGYLANHHITELKNTEVSIGVCLPSAHCRSSAQYKGFEEAFEWLISNKVPFRLIPEAHLTQSWDGLDYLLFSPNGLGPQGKRKLLGFCAAGGIPVTTADLVGIPEEISFHDFLENQNSV